MKRSSPSGVLAVVPWMAAFLAWGGLPARGTEGDEARATTRASSGASQVPASAASSRPTIIPWLELNLPDTDIPTRPGVTRLEHAREGLAVWAKVTDLAIVTTIPARVDAVYTALMRDKPANLHLIGGLKTHVELRAGFHDDQGWETLARAARRVVALTGNNVVVLENETALREFHAGRSPDTLERLALAMRPLAATGLEYWWNMPVVLLDTPASPARMNDTAALVLRVFETVPASRFLTGYRAWAVNPLAKALRGAEDRMHDIVPEARTIEKLHVRAEGRPYAAGKRFFSPDAAAQELARRHAAACIIYTGETDWVRVAEAFSRPPAGRPEDSN